jgi:hypothetical protein
MRAHLRTVLLAGAALTAASAPVAASADPSAVYVRFPLGLSAGITTVSAGPDDEKYVSVEDLVVRNPSRLSLQTADPRDFHLIAGTHTYAPVVRPGFASTDLSQRELVGPNETLRTTVTFRVPASVTRADFEFTPHWYSDDGRTVDYCCEYP